MEWKCCCHSSLGQLVLLNLDHLFYQDLFAQSLEICSKSFPICIKPSFIAKFATETTNLEIFKQGKTFKFPFLILEMSVRSDELRGGESV